MGNKKLVVLLEKGREGDYFLSQLRGTETVQYHGKISLLVNKMNHYSIIYDREIPALSGPPGEVRQLLLAGSEENYETLGKENLEKLTYEAALTEAKKIASKQGLTVRRKV